MKAHILQGEIPDTIKTDYIWSTSMELSKHLDQDYYNNIKDFVSEY
jgi:hypothetical protein